MDEGRNGDGAEEIRDRAVYSRGMEWGQGGGRGPNEGAGGGGAWVILAGEARGAPTGEQISCNIAFTYAKIICGPGCTVTGCSCGSNKRSETTAEQQRLWRRSSSTSSK